MTIYRDGGKGDFRRPVQNKEQFESNWDAIFKKKPEPPTGGFLTTEENEQATITTSTTNNETNLQQTN